MANGIPQEYKEMAPYYDITLILIAMLKGCIDKEQIKDHHLQLAE